MERFKIIVLLIWSMMICNDLYSQEKDSITAPKLVENVSRSPYKAFTLSERIELTQPLSIQLTQLGSYKCISDKYGYSMPDMQVNQFFQAKIKANLNIMRSRRYALNSILGYSYISGKISNIHNALVERNEYNYLYTGVSFTYFSVLLNKIMVYNSTVIVDGSEKRIERVKGLLSGTMVLKADKDTRMTVGVIINIDPLTNMPILPTFSYKHIFKNGFETDIVLPQSIYLRRKLFQKGRISLGAEMDQTTFYLYNVEGVKQACQYGQLNINAVLAYEQLLNDRVSFSVKSGIRQAEFGRIIKKNSSYSRPISKIEYDPAFYVNVGISFRPF